MSSNLFTPSLRYTNKETCNSAWTFIDGQNVSDIEVPKFIKNLFTSFDDSRYGKMGKDLIEGFTCTQPTDPRYDFTNVNTQTLNLDSDSFNITNIQCATGYVGTAVASACTSDGPYTVTGCRIRTCADTDGTGTAFDCSTGTNDLSATPADVSCNGEQCTPAECCTVPRAGGDGSDPCQPHPCQNGGSCTPNADGTSYTCRCTGGYTGNNCETPPSDPCSTSPCQNGGTCSPTADGGSYTCRCTGGYTGDNCETDPPERNTCTTAYGGSTETGVNHPCNVYGLLTKDKYSGPITNYPQWYEPIKEPDNTDNPDTSNTSALSANNFNTCCGKSSWKNYCTLDNWDNSDVVSYLTGLGCPLFADS